MIILKKFKTLKYIYKLGGTSLITCKIKTLISHNSNEFEAKIVELCSKAELLEVTITNSTSGKIESKIKSIAIAKAKCYLDRIKLKIISFSK